MQTIDNTLYVMTQGAYVHLENDAVRVDVERQKALRVPIHHIGTIVCFGNVMVSTKLMHRWSDEGKALVLLTEHGRFKGRLVGPVSGNVLLRIAQFRHAEDGTFCLEVARAMVAGKIRNARQVILRGVREAQSADDSSELGDVANCLTDALRRVPHAHNVDVARGIEGEAARHYFAGMTRLLRDAARGDFQLDGRSRRPPRDRMNALLSFVYAMLMNDCRSAAETTGLDPQVGFLHAVRPGRAALALDLMEELRSYVADRLAISLVNRAQITGQDFEIFDGGAVALREAGRKIVVTAYQKRKADSVTHPLLKEAICIGLIPFIQARLMARTLRGDLQGYLPFVFR